MAYSNYVTQTWTDGSGSTPLSAARLGVMETGILNAFYQPAVHVTHNANQSTTSGANTAIAFNTERFDTAGNAADTMHDTVTNNSRLVARYAGKYQITCCVEFAPVNTTGIRQAYIRLNGATTLALQRLNAVNDIQQFNLSVLHDMAVNDYVEVITFQSSTASENINLSANYSPEFSMVRVG